MIKYKLSNARKSRVSTPTIAGKKIVLNSGEQDKIISFTDYMRFEKSLNALKTSNIISIEKLTGEKAKKAKLSGDEPLSDEAKKKLADEAEAKRLEEEAEAKKLADEAEAKRLEEEANSQKDVTETDESNIEGSDDETETPDSDADSSNPDSDATAPSDESKNTTEEPAQHQNRGNRNNNGRNRNRN